MKHDGEAKGLPPVDLWVAKLPIRPSIHAQLKLWKETQGWRSLLCSKNLPLRTETECIYD